MRKEKLTVTSRTHSETVSCVEASLQQCLFVMGKDIRISYVIYLYGGKSSVHLSRLLFMARKEILPEQGKKARLTYLCCLHCLLQISQLLSERISLIPEAGNVFFLFL